MGTVGTVGRMARVAREMGVVWTVGVGIGIRVKKRRTRCLTCSCPNRITTGRLSIRYPLRKSIASIALRTEVKFTKATGPVGVVCGGEDEDADEEEEEADEDEDDEGDDEDEDSTDARVGTGDEMESMSFLSCLCVY